MTVFDSLTDFAELPNKTAPPSGLIQPHSKTDTK